ncbi:hypothetical protein AWB67_06970 [Caballeronia terrestris]|uniref:ATPase AAA-type core domain-containing protein n=1 Tax=Caballeronia terrestris TaxID=1226301 RepID=A0A158KXR9_9BURK|nr:hypothetical protein [Caballeronia terrestris]SAL85539.1 hypothetical protein AWB67_06970 [Caballeronia terrestris]
MPDAERKDTGPRVLLIGDLASHTMLIREQSEDRADAISDPPYKVYRREPNEPLLPVMIQKALLEGQDIAEGDIKIIPDFDQDAYKSLGGTCGELISALDLFPESSAGKRDKTRLRVKCEYLASPEKIVSTTSQEMGQYAAILSNAVATVSAGPKDCVMVLYDQNAFTRRVILHAEETSSEWVNLRKLVNAATHGLVVAINGDLVQEGWLNKLKLLILPNAAQSGARPPNVLVLITADCLRKAGLNITKYGALENTIKDIFASAKLSPLKELLELAGHVVIVFRETGSLYIDQSGETTRASLHFCPNFDRIAQSDSVNYGDVPGKFSVFLTAVVKELYRAARFHGTVDGRWNIPDALRLGAIGFNQLFARGLRQKAGDAPFKAIENALSADECLNMCKASRNTEKREYLMCSLHLDPKDLPGWDRTTTFLTDTKDVVLARLRAIVERGMDATLVDPDVMSSEPKSREPGEFRPWFPKSYITLPYAAFNNLRLVNAKEIGNHHSLAKIIKKYIETDEWGTPLSIAVFGSPGSGKSFGVKQILESVDPGRKTEPLTFNLAQFSTVDQLTDAFHRIQDRALSSKEVPLAIFDEFDASFETWRGWLKYFLAPMQDGLFRGKNGDYRVGRSIFLFSGGTANSYEEFARPLEKLRYKLAVTPDVPTRLDQVNSPELRGKSRNNVVVTPGATQERDYDDSPEATVVRSSKLGDFASRLRGYLDISDINEGRDKNGVPLALTNATRLRRAVILRSLLDQQAKAIFVSYSNGVQRARIHPTVIDEFLNQKEYLHGVRSMEAIIQMSRWVDGQFVPASLPSREQMAVHVFSPFFQHENKANGGPG